MLLRFCVCAFFIVDNSRERAFVPFFKNSSKKTSSTKTTKRPLTLFNTNNIKTKQTNTTLRHFDNFTHLLCIREGKKTRGGRGGPPGVVQYEKRKNETRENQKNHCSSRTKENQLLISHRLFYFPSLCRFCCFMFRLVAAGKSCFFWNP